ncbi:hypothetical protein BV25DRAFT_1913268 [Artomyces pyxidatus]|uniref:Uncharacterized protein n=1 Tax=Artomyces pyxidatus TaxID=48021 RepID=A0ACB8TCL0_9AGAM|nr:hypothetical protein BV25DRAFT_1913268 [Artomyces pyxidatus]
MVVDSSIYDAQYPPSSQLSPSQWTTRARTSRDDDSGLDVRWQNTQSPSGALAALLSEAKKPLERPRQKLTLQVFELPGPSTSFPSISASTSTSSSRDTQRPRSRSARPRTLERARHDLVRSVDPDDAAVLGKLVKSASEKMDETSRVKQKKFELSKGRKPREASSSRVTKKGTADKRPELGVAGPSGRTRSLEELYDHTNLHCDASVRSSTRHEGLSSMTRASSRKFTEDSVFVEGDGTTLMEVDSPEKEPAKEKWILPQQPSLSNMSTFKPSHHSTLRQPRPLTSDSSHLTKPTLSGTRSRGATLTRAASTPESQSIQSSSTSTACTAVAVPQTKHSHTSAATAPGSRYTPAQVISSHTPANHHPQPSAPRLSQRPPALGMRRPVTGYTSGPATAPAPSQAFKNRVPPFKPPLARPQPSAHAPVTKQEVAPPPRCIQIEDQTAEADSSYEMPSMDMDLLDAVMQKYD